MKSDFLFSSRPGNICHAPSIEEVGGDILVSYFAGTDEHETDVKIFLQRFSGSTWSAPQEIADGEGSSCWNPVLFKTSKSLLYLFYKIGPTPNDWWGAYKISQDNGHSWSDRVLLPEGVLGPTKNKPLEFPDGSLLIPSSDETGRRWSVHLEFFRSSSGFSKGAPLSQPDEVLAIQPALFLYRSGKLQMLSRTASSAILETSSFDLGKTWSSPALSTLANPNSAIDGLVLQDGRALLVFNNAPNTPGAKFLAGPRTPLEIALSSDEGKTFKTALVLESGEGEYSYPSVIQTAKGEIQIVYTYNRENIKRVILLPDQI